MAYKISTLPSPQSYIEEKADFWEIQTIKDPGQYISQMTILRNMSLGMDELDHDGITAEDDRLNSKLDDVHSHIAERKTFCSTSYPFQFGHSSIKLNENESLIRDVYLYLLLCTRLNMKTKKVQNGVDGAELFEFLCAEVAKNYFGKNAESMVFGTAVAGNFKDKVTDLISKIGEGDGYKNPNNNYPVKNDDGIDVVVWKNFSDLRIGKIIGFAQCKTGTSWRNEIHKLKPKKFCDSWFLGSPILQPIPIVFLTDTLHYDMNFYSDQHGFLIFNRFRIMEYLPETIEVSLHTKIKTWLEGALREVA